MDFDLSDEQRTIRDTARDLLARRIPPGRVREAAEAAREDGVLWAEMAELGWPGIAVSEAYGGLGLGLVELCVLLEEQGAALAPTPLLPTTCAALVIARAGSEAQREAWLPALAEGRARGAIGVARRDEAPIVAGSPDPDVIVLADEDACWLMDRACAEVEPVTTIDPLRHYMTVRGAVEPLPGDHERGIREASIAIGAELVGVCQRALDVTVEYVKERRQFGVPVGSFQAVSHRCAEMLLHTESARSTVYFAAWAADAAPERLDEAAALAKYISSEAAVQVTSAAIQAHGGIGFTWEADLHWWYKRAQLSAQLLGGAAEHRARLGEIVASEASLAAATPAS
jgi:alkylation response protein AidB-like acyl-CoA dehydrogenase